MTEDKTLTLKSLNKSTNIALDEQRVRIADSEMRIESSMKQIDDMRAQMVDVAEKMKRGEETVRKLREELEEERKASRQQIESLNKESRDFRLRYSRDLSQTRNESVLHSAITAGAAAFAIIILAIYLFL